MEFIVRQPGFEFLQGQESLSSSRLDRLCDCPSSHSYQELLPSEPPKGESGRSPTASAEVGNAWFLSQVTSIRLRGIVLKSPETLLPFPTILQNIANNTEGLNCVVSLLYRVIYLQVAPS
jgi:hypothetical protein